MRGSAKGDEPPTLGDWKAAQRRNGIEPEYRNLQQPERGAADPGRARFPARGDDPLHRLDKNSSLTHVPRAQG